MSNPRRRSAAIVGIIIAILLVASVGAYYFLTTSTIASSSLTASSVTSFSSSSSPTTTSTLYQSSTSTTTSSSSTNLGYSSSWLTYHDDLSRDGYDPDEPSINATPPQLAWTSASLDGNMYAEPLIYGGAVFVVTENNSVYALNESTGATIWRENLGVPVPGSTLPCGDINPSGITGTPTIDPEKSEIFLVAYTYTDEQQHHIFFAINMNTGSVVFQRNVDPPGVSPLVEQQRGALALANGIIYIPYGGLAGDCGQYHGYVLGVPENNTGSTLSYQTPTGREGGIWAPSGVSVDSSGDVWVATGNSEATTTFDFGDAVIKLSPSLKELDYFAPTNWASLNAGDVDLGSVGPAILSAGGYETVFQIGKQGVGYLLNAQNPGRVGGQEFSSQVCAGAGAYGGTASMFPEVFVPCASGIVAIRIVLAGPNFTTLWTGPSFDAGPPIIAGNAVWTVNIGSGILCALNPNSGATIFTYNMGGADHFITPSSAGGKVYVAALNKVFAFSI